MKRTSQSPRCSVLCVLANHSGKMTRSTLRRDTGIKLADLDIILLSKITLEQSIKNFKFAP